MTLRVISKCVRGSNTVSNYISNNRLLRHGTSCYICSTATLLGQSPRDSDLRNNPPTDASAAIETKTATSARLSHPHRRSNVDKSIGTAAPNPFPSTRPPSQKSTPIKQQPKVQRDPPGNNSTLSACTKALSNIMERRNAFPVIPTSWLHFESASKFFKYGSINTSNLQDSYTTQDILERVKLFDQVLILLQAIKLSIKAGRITALSGKDTQHLSVILGRCLLLCSEAPPTQLIQQYATDIPLSQYPADAAIDIIHTLRTLNLNIQPEYYSHAIRAACHDGKFKEAAKLFLHQIDPENEGYIPMDSQLGWNTPMETGFYAIVMSVCTESQSKGENNDRKEVAYRATEQILEAMEKMSMVSAHDQDKYIIAAGSALGRAGLWEGIVLFHDSAENRAKFGQPLVAASMYACILAGQYDIAVFLYYALINDSMMLGAEWQWGGQSEGIHPLCKELFLRAVGKVATEIDSDRYADDSVAIFNDIISNGGNLSPSSLYGLFLTLQRSSKDIVSLNILQTVMNHKCDENNWNIVDEDVNNFLQTIDKLTAPLKTVSGLDVVDGKIVSSVMMSFVQNREFGMALLIGRLISSVKTNGDLRSLDISLNALDGAHYRSDHHVSTLISSDISFWNVDEYQETVLHCFRHLNCPGVVDQLRHQQAEDSKSPSVPSVNNSWLEAYSHIHYLSQIHRDLASEKIQLTRLQMYHLLKTLARMMDCCTDAGQPRAGIHLLKLYAQDVKAMKTKETQTSILTLITDSIFGRKEIDGISDIRDNMVSQQTIIALVLSSDALLCATVRAIEKAQGIQMALDFYFATQNSVTGNLSNASKQAFQIITTNYVLSLLVKCGRIDDFTSLLNRIPEAERNRETFSVIAQMYANLGKWNDVALLYNSANEKGLLTESLGLLAMKGVERSVMDGKVRALRAIASDLAALTSEQPDKWIASRYWTLKKYVGFHYARLLMWWRNPESTQQNELGLAIRNLESYHLHGIPMNDDALRVITKFVTEKYNRTKAENDRLAALETILESLKVAEQTSLMTDGDFISEAALSLQLLKAPEECYNLVVNAIDRGVEVDTVIVKKIMAVRPSKHTLLTSE